MLETLANIAQVLSALAVVAGIVFGLAQVRQFRQQRRDALAVELMKSIQDSEFIMAMRTLLQAPAEFPAQASSDAQSHLDDAAWVICARYETLGYLIHIGIMPMELVEQLVGGIGVHLWTRLRPWTAAIRQRHNQPLMFEWFQWLAELLEKRGRPSAVPAYLHMGSEGAMKP